MSDLIGYAVGLRTDAQCIERVQGAEVIVRDARCLIGVVRSASPTVHTKDSTVWVGMMTADRPGAHYARASWRDGALLLDVDAHEQRRIYWRHLPNDGGVLFATRIDLVRMPQDELDDEAFVGQWASVINFSRRTLLRDVHRVPAGETLVFDGRHVRYQTSAVERAATDPDVALHESLRACMDRNVVLGLSGGVDSRTLMAALHGAHVPFTVHTYGTPDMPDVRRAMDVSALDGVRATFTDLSVESWNVDDVLTSMRTTAWQSEGSYPGAHALVFDRAADRLGPNALLVDGGYGALLRGGFGNALLARRFDVLKRKDGHALSALLRKRDASMLRQDLREHVDTVLAHPAQYALDMMPTVTKSEARAWMDEFFRRWYTRGYVSAPQAVYDARLLSTMPYLDSAVVRSSLSMPAQWRANGRWFRRIISAQRPVLRSLPVVGKRCDVPWFATARPAMTAAWSRIAPSYAHGIHSGIERSVYAVVRPAILDLAHTTPPAPWDLWDLTVVRRMAIDTLPDGDPGNMASLLDWLGYRLM